MKEKFLILNAILLMIYSAYADDKKVVCYWNSNSHIHTGLPGEFHASDIDPTICTHIIYGHVWFTSGANPGARWTPEDKTQEFLSIKSKNPNVKLLIGIGGPQWGQIFPSQLVSTSTQRDDLAKAIKNLFTQRSGFDGCDIDWQWPAQGNGKPEDYDNFPLFLSELKIKLGSQYILSVSVAARNEDIQKSYDISKILDAVDFVNLNSYNMRGVTNDQVTAFHSPYSKNLNDLRPEADWNAVSIVNSWITRGASPEKLTLGVATYGRSFTLENVNEINVDAPIDGLGNLSKFLIKTNDEKINVIPYGEICLNLQTVGSGWSEYWDEPHFAPLAVFDENQWVGYDNKKSVIAKIHLAIDNELGGLNFAALDYDDFAGNCGAEKFPLILLGYNALVNGVRNGFCGIIDDNPVNPTTTTPKPGVTTPDPTTTTTTTPTTSTTTPTTTTKTPTTTTKTPTTTTKTPTTTTPTTTTPTTTTNPPTSAPDPDDTSTTPTTEAPTTTVTTKPTSTTTRSSPTTTTTDDFKTPPVTPSTIRNGDHLSSTGNPVSSNDPVTTTMSETETRGISSLVTTTTDFKTPPVTPTTTIDGGESGEEPGSTTEGESNEGSGESSESSESIEGSGSSEGDGNNGSITPFPDDPSSTIPAEFICPTAYGNFKHPSDCTRFYICSHNVAYLFDCQIGLYYNEETDQCDYLENVQC